MNVKVASRAFYELLRPAAHDVALGTIGRASSTTSSCPTVPSSNQSSGPWIPMSLCNDYDPMESYPPDSPPSLNSSSRLASGIDCIGGSSSGTNLGDPILAAGDHLLSYGRPDAANGIVFITDGEATRPNSSTGRDYAKSQAELVQAQDISIVPIALRLQGVDCSSEPTTSVLAAMASDPVNGPASADDGGDGPGVWPVDA